ncbi:Sphingolipid C9-methyltransferase 1 [Ranunculus cassubicifolius]
MSSCCNGKCGCGSSCSCGSSCNGCGMFPDIREATTSETLILGVAPVKTVYEATEMGVGAENDACKCGPNCSCNPCNCK